MMLGWASAALAAAPGALTSLRAIHALTNDQASEKVPVNFEATVGYSRGYESLLFVQDGDVAIFVRPQAGTRLVPGDRILIEGVTRQSFRPLIIGNKITLLRHDAPPRPLATNFDELIRAEHDSMLVTMHGVIRAADLLTSQEAPVRSARLQMVTEGGHFEADVDSNDANALKGLLDDEVEITGAAAGKFDDKMQQTGIVLYVSSLGNIEIVKSARGNLWSLPVMPMDRVLAVYHASDLTPRVRVQGTITYYEPGAAVVLQEGSKSLWIETHTREPLQIGDRAQAIGFPEAHERRLSLADGEIEDSNVFQPIAPIPATWQQLGFWTSNMPVGHLYDLVSIEGKVETEVREASQDEYVLSADGRLFTAIYRHPHSSGALPPMMEIPPGSRVRVTGICMIPETTTITPGEEVPFNILLRSFDDFAVLARPSLLNVRNLILLVGLLIAVVVATGAWGWAIERKVRRQTAALAYVEQRRSRILEDINNSRPLAAIIEQITELVSFRLRGAPCWCQIADGAQLGNCPPDLAGFRVVEEQIPSRSGAPLGTVSAALDARSEPREFETGALSMASALTALAVETHRLYSDLLHRSEFDLLTDTHNRFSLDKRLDTLIGEARQSAGMFGLIYVDLDHFKQINDIYGHHTGDLFLQEVAFRMKRQLRSVDTLARLGGDEFAALLPAVHCRADVEEIALRLEQCFDEPFAVENMTLRGSASVGIAVYPHDATTKGLLFNTADTAMYAAKYAKRKFREESETQPVAASTEKY